MAYISPTEKWTSDSHTSDSTSVRTLGALAKSVSRRLMTDSASIASLLNDSTYCSTLGYNQYTIPALFIPNTYEVYWTMSAEDFIKRMKKEHDRFWNKERMEKAKSIGFTPEEVATLASIVEEETANKAEKPMVAGLLYQPPAHRYALAGRPHCKIWLARIWT